LKHILILFVCVFSMYAQEVVLFDDIASLQRWYDEQLKQKQMQLNSQTDVNVSKVKESEDINISCISEEVKFADINVSSIKQSEINQTSISVSKFQPSKQETVNQHVEMNTSDINMSQLTQIMEKNSTKPIVIVKYVGDKNSQSLCQSLSKEYIDFWNLLDLALINATGIILKKHDIKITEENLDIIRSQYYPNLSLGYAGEYYHGFSGTAKTGVGGTYYPSTSEYRDSLSLNVNHELYRFGATDLKVKIGEKDVALVKKELELQAEDISQRLLGTYTSALRAQNTIKYKQRIKSVQEDILEKKWRLYKSGQVAKIVLAKDQLSLVKLEKEIAQQKLTFMRAIKEIEKLANITIDASRSKFAMLEPKNIKVKSFEESAGAKYLKLQIEKKLHELELVRKDYLPAVYASGEYVMLGSDKALFESINDLKRNNWDVGLNIQWNLFNGYKTNKTIDKIKYELKKLMERYRLAKVDFEAKQEERVMLQKSIEKLLKIETDIYDQTCEQEEILSKLHGVGLVDGLQIDYVKISKIQSELDFRLSVIDKVYQTISGELIR